MKLAAFLAVHGRSLPAPTRSVKFKILGADVRKSGTVAPAEAEIAFVSETSRQEALRNADAAIATEYEGQLPSGDRREDERMYHVLHRALRDKDDVRQPFAESPDELKAALVLPEAARIWREYLQFVDEEFPEWVDAETFEKLVAESKKTSLPDLLSSFGSDVVRRSMPGLLSRLQRSATPT
jgi:hypothetical protein